MQLELKDFTMYEFCISTPTYTEFVGAERKKHKARARKTVAPFPVLLLDPACARCLATLCFQLEFSPHHAMDMQIAALALGHEIPLLTSNVKHFEHVPALQLVGYLQP